MIRSSNKYLNKIVCILLFIPIAPIIALGVILALIVAIGIVPFINIDEDCWPD